MVAPLKALRLRRADVCMVLGLRPAHDPRKAYGFVGVVVSTANLSASVFLWERGEDGTVSVQKVIEIPAEPAEPTSSRSC